MLEKRGLSVMDVVSLAGAGVTGLYVIFGQGQSIALLETGQEHLKGEVYRIERQAENHDKDILDQVKQQRVEIHLQREETRKGFDKLDGKLDKLIEHELRQNRENGASGR